MASFIDDLGRKATGLGDKARKMADVSRLNGYISEEERVLNNLYFQIGKLYATIHSNDYEKDFEGIILSIKETERKIADLRQQIYNIKGITKCDKCGSEAPNNVPFCPSCGAPMTKFNENSDMVKCPSCGNTVQKGMRFCTACGTAMPIHNTMQNNPIVPPPVQQPSVQQIQEPPEKLCPYCSAPLDDDSAFCTECGAKI